MPRKPTNTNPPPNGRRFLYWIAEAALAVRAEAHASPERVADLIGVGSPTVKRFEKAQNWPADPDRVMAAYAEVGGLEDPREIYQRALDLWHKHGSKPLLSAKDDDGALTPGQRFEQEISARRARPRGPAESEETTSATRKRRASS